jgi:enoyl-CoA hydratase/carnithine racemase
MDAFSPPDWCRAVDIGAAEKRDAIQMSTQALTTGMNQDGAAAEPLVRITRADGVATLTLNRGARFNPLSSEMIAALHTALDDIARDHHVQVVVIAAEGRGFCAGHDLKEMRAHAKDHSWQRKLFDDCSRMMTRLTELPQPVIARVQGIATAAGCQLVSMCDLAVASDTATFALPGVNIGVFCSTPAVGVARNVGRKRAMELLLTGAPIDAATAMGWGLVNRVVPADQLDAEVQRLIDLILARSAATIAMGKSAFYQQIERPLAAAYDLTSETMACNMALEDAAEGIDAFLQKRAATWRGR